jgi:ribonucleoside-triphosphate reductase
MIVGDGWEYGDTIFISQKKGTAIRERIESTLKDNCIHYIEVAGHTDRIAISDKRFVNFIAKCDLGHMSENRRMPHFWVNAPKKFLVGLVAGLFDAEGSLGGANKNLPQVRMTGRTAVLQTREILSALGCTSTISAYGPYNRDGSFKSNHRMYSLVMKFNDGAASEIRAFSEKLSGIEYSSTRGAHKVDGRGIVTVQKIVEHPQFIDRVYDITTSTGTFTCNGIHSHNCYAWSTHWLMGCGIPTGQLVSKPPKHAASFIGQVAEVVMEMSQEFAGAVAPADLLVAYAYYAERDGLTDKEIENHLQSFVHIVNRQFRTGAQSPFTNVSVFDRPNLENLFKDMVYPDGSKINYEYVEHVQEIFLNWFSKGTSNGTPFRFPVATINGTKDENNNIVDKKFLKMISRCNTPLACFNLHFAEGSKLAMCCRYINDPARMRQFGADSFGNGGLNIGSHRIVLLNIPRAAYQAHGDTDSLFRQIDEYMDDARDILIVHRERILGKRIDQGFLKWFNVGVASLNKMFSTFGFTGIPEAVQTMGLDPQSREGVELGKKILKHMDKRAAEISIETGYAFNIEEVPGESAAINLADKDRLFFTDDVKVDMYSNQFVPLAADVPLTTRIAIEGELMSTVSGGAITHINLDEKITNPEIMEKLITYVVSKGVTHFAINYGFTLCEKDGGFAGLREKCPKCGSADVEHMTRVVGYFVPVKSWTKKRQEKDFPNRTKYSIGDLK